MDQIPETLYKYISWSDDENDVRKNILYKNILHFSNPVNFNDPFDSMLPVIFHEDYIGTEQFHIDFMEAMRKIKKNSYTDDEIRNKAKAFMDDPSQITYVPEIMTEGVRNQTINYTRISSFTTKPTNILMWSHYANCHTGICIGFKTKYFDLNSVMIEKVLYSNDFPKLESLKNIPLLITKSLDWKYENEYRLITISINEMYFNKEAICEVIIGHKMKESIIMNLIDYLSIYYSNIKVFMSVPNAKSFAIDLVKLN